jgi:hypothetical protein
MRYFIGKVLLLCKVMCWLPIPAEIQHSTNEETYPLRANGPGLYPLRTVFQKQDPRFVGAWQQKMQPSPLATVVPIPD